MSGADLEERVRRLEDRAEIAELIARYCVAMDDRDVDAFPRLFTPDVRIRSGDGAMDARGLADVTAMFTGRFAVLGPSHHFTHDRVVEFDGGDGDAARGLVLAHAEMNRRGEPMLAAIRYHDVYARHDGCWKFRERELRFFYYVRTAEYLDALGPGLAARNRAYDAPRAADWPEGGAAWRRFHDT